MVVLEFPKSAALKNEWYENPILKSFSEVKSAKSIMKELCIYWRALDSYTVLRRPQNSGNIVTKPAVVLGLENTLIVTTRIRTQATDFYISDRNRRLYVQLRPNVLAFLNQLDRDYDIHFFTALPRHIGEQIIRRIAPFVAGSKCFYREDCLFEKGYEVKDLTLVKRPLSETIAIDCIFGSFIRQPRNAIILPPWQGESGDTTLLTDLLPVLRRSAPHSCRVQEIYRMRHELKMNNLLC